MDVGLDLTESPPDGMDLGVLHGHLRQHGAGSGRLVTMWPRSVSALIKGAPRGGVVLHQQELCHDMTVPVSAVSALRSPALVGRGTRFP
jgi:hypothetical protein